MVYRFQGGKIKMKVKKNWMLISLILISFVATIFVYGNLPSEIPRHWNIMGEVDGYWGKGNVFFTAFLPLAIYVLMMLLPKIDPKKSSYEMHKKAYSVTMFAITLFLIVIHWVTIYASLGNSINVTVLVSGGVGILFVVLGNYMGQIRHNYFFGIRNPWTLANEEVWAKTHRVGRYAFVLLGLIFIVSAFLPGPISAILIGVGIAILLFFSTVYSYLLFRKINKEKI